MHFILRGSELFNLKSVILNFIYMNTSFSKPANVQDNLLIQLPNGLHINEPKLINSKVNFKGTPIPVQLWDVTIFDHIYSFCDNLTKIDLDVLLNLL